MLLLPIPSLISNIPSIDDIVTFQRQSQIVQSAVYYSCLDLQPVVREPLLAPLIVTGGITKGIVYESSLIIKPEPEVSKPQGTETKQPVAQEPQGKRVNFVVTAYSAQDKGVNRKGITASGAVARPWYTVAASRGYPFGTRIHLIDLKKTVVVQDRGGSIKGNRLDLFVGSRKEALKFGRKKMEGIVLSDNK